MKENKNQTNFTYDPNLKPFYKSNIKVNDKHVLIYDLDVHCNNLLLARKGFMTEYYTEKNECLILPKEFAQNLYLTDDNILDTYMKTQQSARDSIKSDLSVIAIVTFLYIVVAVLSVFGILVFNLLYVTIPYALFYGYTYFLKKNVRLRKSYQNFIYILTKKYPKQEIVQNIENIIEHTKTLNYMDEKQKLKTINHFVNLQKLIK